MTFRGSDESSLKEMWLESFISNVIFWKSPIVGHFVEVMRIVEQNSNQKGSFLRWFFLHFCNRWRFCRSDENS